MRAPEAEEWSTRRVASGEIEAAVARDVAAGRFPLGDADLYLADPAGRFEFRLCHERDVHFASADAGLMALVERRWRELGYEPKEYGRRGPAAGKPDL